MSVQRTIEGKIRDQLDPVHLEVIDESHMHSVPPGSESHFKLVVVSDAFAALSRVERQRKVNGILARELENDLHALSMETLTADEWERRGGKTFATPPCLGGGKADG